MFIFTFNIIQKDNGDSIILTEYPSILVNESLPLLIQEIRNIIKYNFETLSLVNKIPIVDFQLNFSTYDDMNFIKMHSFKIDLENVRESKEIIKKISKRDVK